MARTVKKAKADIYLRDTDSQGQYNNSGVLVFLYFHEWNDCYNPTTGKTAQIDGEVYDEETGAYKPNCPEGYSPVFNGRLSALWDNMVACFPERVQGMYKTMRDNGLSYKDMMGKYKEFWRFWCENLYNADAFGYMNTNNFTKAYGDKMQVMDFFFQKRQRYMDSKYCCGSSASNNLRLRLYETGKGLAIKYYQAIYSSLQWGANNFSTQRNIEPGTYSYMPFGFNNPQDATFDIDDADLITELSTYTKSSDGYTITGLEGLGDFKFDLNMGLLKRLTKFVMNYTIAKPNTKEQGDNFDLSGMKMLRQVTVRNVKNLKKSIVIGSDMVEEIDFTNTPIVGVSTPPSDALVSLVLPDTITSLRLKGYTNLTDKGLQVAGYGNVDEFEVEDCPNIDAYALLEKCREAGAPLTQVTLKDVDWELDSLSLLMYLAEKKARLTGRIAISEGVSLSLAQKLQLMSAWGDIDNKDNGLYITYNVVEISSVSVSGRSFVYEKGDYTYKGTTLPSTGNNVKEFYWSISENNFATISSDGVLTLSKAGSKEADDKATITLSVVLSDGSTKEASKEVKFYKKDCELGDYVFSDGTYASNLSDNSECTPVGVVFYLEPVKRRWAVAVALDKYKTERVWGLTDTGGQNIAGIKLNEYTDNVYDISNLQNVTSPEYFNITDSAMLDSSNAENDGFKEYDSGTSAGDIGFAEITPQMYQMLQEYLDDVGLQKGSVIAAGMQNTLKIIKHRNSILRDSAINLPVPTKTSVKTEEENLIQCISDVVSAHDNADKYQQYYYPAASFCYSYLPAIRKGEKLSEGLSLHHWFLPAIGELARIMLYIQHKDDEFDIFSSARQEGKFVSFGTDNYMSSTETSNAKMWCGGFFSYNINGQGIKSQILRFRPCVAIKL